MTTIQISERGTLTLPKSVRKALGIDRAGTLVADISKEGVVLRPCVTFPIEMYSDKRILEFDAEDERLARRLRRKKA